MQHQHRPPNIHPRHKLAQNSEYHVDENDDDDDDEDQSSDVSSTSSGRMSPQQQQQEQQQQQPSTSTSEPVPVNHFRDYIQKLPLPSPLHAFLLYHRDI